MIIPRLFRGMNRNMRRWAVENFIMFLIVVVVSIIAMVYEAVVN